MEFPRMVEIIKERIPDAIVEANDKALDPFIKIRPECLKGVARLLKEHEEISMDMLLSISGVDYSDHITVVYHLFSLKYRHGIVIKLDLPRDNPKVDTVEDIWKAANWHEREAYDLFGVIFNGHPDLRRILLPDDWEGHPLRKDYKYPSNYHGLPL
uniref:NADH dehydrogenase I subunit C n=1 Tax=uncultured prokaryote TaxID=198431 RepID=H5SP98_9ZZZZ|nr:NADH dehydrogenase I subunit C [uncultured prokaryote]